MTGKDCLPKHQTHSLPHQLQPLVKQMSPFKSAGSSSPKQCLLGCSGLAIWGLPGLSQKGYHISDRFPCGWTYSSFSEPASPFSFLLVYPLVTLKAMKSKSRKLLIIPFSFVEQKTVRTSAGAARKFRACLFGLGCLEPMLNIFSPYGAASFPRCQLNTHIATF